MPHVNFEEGLRLRFPGRTGDFHVGVEIGMIATLMTVPLQQFTRRVSADAANQAVPLAAKLGYRLEAMEAEPDADGTPMVELTMRLGLAEMPASRPRPFLSVVGGADMVRSGT